MSQFYLLGHVAAVSLAIPILFEEVRQPMSRPATTARETAVSATDRGRPVDQYVAHIRRLVTEFDALADLLDQVEDDATAQAIVEPTLARCDGASEMLAEVQELPQLSWMEAVELRAFLQGGIQAQLDAGTQRFMNSAVRASQNAPGSEALKKLSTRFQEMATEIDAAMAKLSP